MRSAGATDFAVNDLHSCAGGASGTGAACSPGWTYRAVSLPPRPQLAGARVPENLSFRMERVYPYAPRALRSGGLVVAPEWCSGMPSPGQLADCLSVIVRQSVFAPASMNYSQAPQAVIAGPAG